MKNKKLLIISIFFYPEPIGISKYTSEMASWLSNSEFDVHVITAKPFYPQWEIYSDYQHGKWWYSSDSLGSVKITRCPLWVPKKANGLKRIFHLASFGFSSSFAVLAQLFKKPDFILVILPTAANVPIAVFLAKVLRKPSWLHIQDFELDLAENLSILGNIKKPFILLKKLEYFFYRSFDRVSTISHGMVSKLINDKQIPSSKTILFPNWVDSTTIRPIETSPFRKQLSIDSETVVALYAGNMGRKYDLEMLINVAKHFSDNPKLLFVFCGDGVARSELEFSCKGLKNVVFLPLQPDEKLNDLLNLADIHLLPQKERAADSVMPSKLLGILASGKPVIATVTTISEIGKTIQDCGIIVSPGDTAAFTESLQFLANNPEIRHNLGTKGREIAVQKFGKDVILAKLQEDIACFFQ